MNIIQVVPHVGNEASGPSYTCVRLSQAIADQDHDVLLASVKDGLLAAPGRFRHEVYSQAAFPSFLRRSPQLYKGLLRHTRYADIVHNNSLWIMPNVYPGWAARACNKPLVISPRGTLSEWSWQRSRLKKQLFWSVFQSAVVRQAALLHATCEAEYRDIRRRGLMQPVCIIPNGIDLPADLPKAGAAAGRRRLMFLGRIHPTKGVDLLLHAWRAVSPRYNDWELDVVGPNKLGYLDEMKLLAQALGAERVNFIGPLYGVDKVAAYSRADLYVLPTRSENFGVSVAESLASGTPAIVTKGAPWGGLEQHEAGWWIDIGVEPLVACLDKALACSSEELAAMGAAGRRWMQKDFSWTKIAKQMVTAYSWLLEGGQAPEWVRTD